MKHVFTLVAALLMAATAFAINPLGRPAAVKATGNGVMKDMSVQMSAAPARAMAKTPAKTTEPVVPGTDWSEWQDMGAGVLTLDDGMDTWLGMPEYTGSFEGKTMMWRYDKNDKAMQQFCLKGVFNNVDLLIDWNEHTLVSSMGLQSTGIEMDGAKIQVCDFGTAYRIFEVEGMTPEEREEAAQYYQTYNYYIKELDRHYIYLGIFMEGMSDAMGMIDVQFQGANALNCMPVISVNRYMPSQTESVTFGMGMGEGAYKVRYQAYSSFYKKEMLDDMMAGAGMSEITAPNNEITVAAPGKPGICTIMAVTYNKLGQPLEMDYTNFNLIADDSAEWTTLGTGKLTSDFLESLFTIDPSTVDVTVQESNSTPGLYRVLDPFATVAYPLNDSEADFDSEYGHHMIIDATDPDGVLMPPFDTGLTWNFASGMTHFICMSEGSYQMEVVGNTKLGILKGKGLLGKLQNKVVTFPVNGLRIHSNNWPQFGGPLGAILSCGNGAFSLTIPESGQGSGVEGVSIDSTATTSAPVYYNLQGVRVERPASGQLLLERRGTTVVKRLMK